MNTSIDRQSILDNLTAIETTAKLLVNAFVKKSNDTELSLNGIHREELVHQTTTFLSQAQKLILNLSNTFSLSTDGFFQKSLKDNLDDETTSIPLADDTSQTHYHTKDDSHKSNVSKTFSSSSSVTLDDIIQNRLTPNDLLLSYPLLHDSTPPNLVSLARNLRSIENLDNLMLKAHTKIFNHEERICCNYDGTVGKLSYPRHKRILLDLILKLTLDERNRTVTNDERRQLYANCEKHFSIETTLSEYRGLGVDQLNKISRINDEKQFVCALFRYTIPKDDVQRILSAKQNNLSTEWNDNELCIYYTHLIYLLWIKQKWLERFPLNSKHESEKWSQCIDWAIESFLDFQETRLSKRKTKEISIDQKKSKNSLTLEVKCKQIDRTKYDVIEYAAKILQFISDENEKNLPTLKQLQFLNQIVFHFYWTPDKDRTWSNILDLIRQILSNESNEDFCRTYSKKLLEENENEQSEIERLLQIKLKDN